MQQQAPHNVVNTNQKHKRSLGENLFDTGLYTGIGFGVNTALSIYLTYLVEKRYPEFFPKLGEKFEKNMLKLGATGTNGLAQFGEDMSKNISLLSGGFAVLPFIKWGEDNKKPIIRGLDKKLGTLPPSISMPDGSQVDTLDLEPKQSWTSLLSGRIVSIFVGYVPLAAMVKTFPNYHKPLTNALGPIIEKGPAWLPKGKPFHKTVSMEFISSAITTISLYSVSKFVAFWQAQREEGKSGNPPQLAGAMQIVREKPRIVQQPPETQPSSATTTNKPSTKLQEVAEHAPLESKPQQLEYI